MVPVSFLRCGVTWSKNLTELMSQMSDIFQQWRFYRSLSVYVLNPCSWYHFHFILQNWWFCRSPSVHVLTRCSWHNYHSKVNIPRCREKLTRNLIIALNQNLKSKWLVCAPRGTILTFHAEFVLNRVKPFLHHGTTLLTVNGIVTTHLRRHSAWRRRATGSSLRWAIVGGWRSTSPWRKKPRTT